MGLLQGKPYKQKDRVTGEWKTIIPEPVDMSVKKYACKATNYKEKRKLNAKSVI